METKHITINDIEKDIKFAVTKFSANQFYKFMKELKSAHNTLDKDCQDYEKLNQVFTIIENATLIDLETNNSQEYIETLKEIGIETLKSTISSYIASSLLSLNDNISNKIYNFILSNIRKINDDESISQIESFDKFGHLFNNPLSISRLICKFFYIQFEDIIDSICKKKENLQ